MVLFWQDWTWASVNAEVGVPRGTMHLPVMTPFRLLKTQATVPLSRGLKTLVLSPRSLALTGMAESRSPGRRVGVEAGATPSEPLKPGSTRDTKLSIETN